MRPPPDLLLLVCCRKKKKGENVTLDLSFQVEGVTQEGEEKTLSREGGDRGRDGEQTDAVGGAKEGGERAEGGSDTVIGFRTSARRGGEEQ